MHPGSDEHQHDPALDRYRQSNVAVLKQSIELKGGFVDNKHPQLASDHDHLQRTKRRGKRNLEKVKPDRSADVEVRIDVVNVMEAPQERPGMIRAVPVIERKIEKQERRDALKRYRHLHYPRQSPSILGHRLKQPGSDRADDHKRSSNRERRDDRIDDDAATERLFLSAQRKRPLQRE